MGRVIDPVYVVRHGESQWNARGIIQGQTPHPGLTAAGRRQSAEAARRLGSLLAPDVPVLVSSSDLRRAAQTAEIVATSLGAEIRFDRRLRERALGRFEGGPRAGVTSRLDALAFSDAPAGGESLAQVAQRVIACLLDLDRSMPHVVVTHGEVIRALGGSVDAGSATGARTVANGQVLLVSGDLSSLGGAP
jgi:broad specificity phosphatase PhoE